MASDILLKRGNGDALVHIFGFLDSVRDLAAVSKVSKLWNQTAHLCTTWKKFLANSARDANRTRETASQFYNFNQFSSYGEFCKYLVRSQVSIISDLNQDFPQVQLIKELEGKAIERIATPPRYESKAYDGNEELKSKGMDMIVEDLKSRCIAGVVLTFQREVFVLRILQNAGSSLGTVEETWKAAEFESLKGMGICNVKIVTDYRFIATDTDGSLFLCDYQKNEISPENERVIGPLTMNLLLEHFHQEASLQMILASFFGKYLQAGEKSSSSNKKKAILQGLNPQQSKQKILQIIEQKTTEEFLSKELGKNGVVDFQQESSLHICLSENGILYKWHKEQLPTHANKQIPRHLFGGVFFAKISQKVHSLSRVLFVVSPEKRTSLDVPAKPHTAYLFFVNQAVQEMKLAGAKMNFGEVGQLLGARWKDMPANERQIYEEKARADRERFGREKNFHERLCNQLLKNNQVLVLE